MTGTPPNDADAIQYAALALLHREIESRGEVRLSRRDLDAYDEARDIGKGLHIGFDEATGDVIFTHPGLRRPPGAGRAAH